MTYNYYALKMGWEYTTQQAEGDQGPLAIRSHFGHFEEKSRQIFGEHVNNLATILYEYLMDKAPTFSIMREQDISLMIGRSEKQSVRFPPYLIVKTIDLKLPTGEWTGDIYTTEKNEEGLPIRMYSSKFKKFQIMQIDSSFASNYVKKNPLHFYDRWFRGDVAQKKTTASENLKGLMKKT